MGRKSSGGNPWHDEKGRFTSPGGGQRSKPRNYMERTEAIENGDYDKKDARDLKALANRALENPNGGKQGKWNIQPGGYDLQYEGYYDGMAAFGVVDDEVRVYQPGFRAYAEDFAAVSGYPIEPAKFKGEIEDMNNLPSGRYRVDSSLELSGRGKVGEVFVSIDKDSDSITMESDGRTEKYNGPIHEWTTYRKQIDEIPCEGNGYSVSIEDDGDSLVITRSSACNGIGHSAIYEGYCQNADKVVFDCNPPERNMTIKGQIEYGDRKQSIELQRKGYSDHFRLFINGHFEVFSGETDDKEFTAECKRIFSLYDYNYRKVVEYK